MREIKFRGNDGADWIYGMTIEYDKDTDTYSMLSPEIDEWVYVKNVGQYTGLKDSEGIEVYEDDIMFDPIENNFYVVTFDENYAYFFLKNVSEAPDKPDYDFAEYDVEVCNSLYVVGNVFDNPKLLEVHK